MSEFTFAFEGSSIAAIPGDTVASALYRAGVRIFSRSVDFNRPRGLLCCTGNCNHCEMTVDGVPNTKACMTAVHPATLVERGRRLDPMPREYEQEWLFADVAVVGGGRAGVAAALEHADRGARVVLIERRSHPQPACPNGVTVLTNAHCFAIYEGNLLGISQGGKLVQLRAANVIVATGTYETTAIFDGNDLPGVMLSTGVERLVQEHGLAISRRVTLIDAGGDMLRMRALLGDAVPIVAVTDVLAAEGNETLSRVRTRHGDYDCDLAIVCGPRIPDIGLLVDAGAKPAWSDSTGAFIASQLPAGIEAAGSVTGTRANRLFDLPAPSPAQMVCACMDVTAEALSTAIHAGFEHIELLKRFTKAGKGHCQGRMCGLAITRLCARESGSTPAQTGVTVSRSPHRAVSLGELAGPPHKLTRKTPLHALHEAAGAVWMDMGAWKRPRYYSTLDAPDEGAAIQAEYRAVRERAGIIDIGTLGKLDLRGRDSARLLDKVYAGRFSNLAVNRTRYALMCDESGVILDDGTVSRVAADRYFLTTTTGNLEFVQQWLEWWTAGTGWDAHVTNLTSGLASINVAGPHARSTLGKLTMLDLSTQAFPYMGCAETTLAGIPATLLRIGFVGETGWEIHVPAEYGEHLWQSVLEAGAAFGIRPFGVECQRLLRLEKRHIILGVDTDSLSTPLDAGLEWAVKLDKPDFVGRAALQRLSANHASDRLIGFRMEGNAAPAEGSAIVRDGKLIGRVTSAKYSPSRAEVIGLAWLPEELSPAASLFHIHNREARVIDGAFYDPDGGRMKQ